MGSSLVWCWPMITFQPCSSAHLFSSSSSCMGKNATGMEKKRKKKNLLSLLYQGQLLCEALDLSNQARLSVFTSNSHPPTSASPLKGALILSLTTHRYDQRHAYYFIDCDLRERGEAQPESVALFFPACIWVPDGKIIINNSNNGI